MGRAGACRGPCPIGKAAGQEWPTEGNGGGLTWIVLVRGQRGGVQGWEGRGVSNRGYKGGTQVHTPPTTHSTPEIKFHWTDLVFPS